jgi:hypothetical protein
LLFLSRVFSFWIFMGWLLIYTCNFCTLNRTLKLFYLFCYWISGIHLIDKILLLVDLALSQHVVLILLKVSATKEFLLYLIIVIVILIIWWYLAYLVARFSNWVLVKHILRLLLLLYMLGKNQELILIKLWLLHTLYHPVDWRLEKVALWGSEYFLLRISLSILVYHFKFVNKFLILVVHFYSASTHLVS